LTPIASCNVFSQRAAKYDVILEIVGDRKPSQMKRVLTDTGTCVFLGAKDMGNWSGPLVYMARTKHVDDGHARGKVVVTVG
jgi:hypothetical protein